MNKVEVALRRAASDIDKFGFSWALVGGLAVSVRSTPRFTQDVDLAVVVSGDDEAEDLVRVFLLNGYKVLATLEHDETDRLVTVRMVASSHDREDVIVDLLFASSGIEPEIVEAASLIEIAEGFPRCLRGGTCLARGLMHTRFVGWGIANQKICITA